MLKSFLRLPSYSDLPHNNVFEAVRLYYTLLINVISKYNTLLLFFSLHFKSSEDFSSTSHRVNHMEFDLSRNDGSILFSHREGLKTTDGKKATEVASGFDSVTGFRQLNASHIVLVEHYNHCLKMYNRKDKSAKLFAGKCGLRGHVDGTSAVFGLPWSVVIDERNPGNLLVTEWGNGALRSVAVDSGIVSTVIEDGLLLPKGLAWYNGRLLVCNSGYISEISWDSKGTVSNKRLTTGRRDYRNSGLEDYRDGDFSIALIDDPAEIQQISDGLFLVLEEERLRVMNMFHKKVLPVCIESGPNCAVSTVLRHGDSALLANNESVYLGDYGITKLTG